jgi:hypothetical protein
MAKRIIKSERIQEIINNIASDFRYTNEVGSYALLFYKYTQDNTIRANDIDMMLEYVTTSLSELHNAPEWRAQHLQDNPEQKETQVLENMFIIEQEYKELLEFLS